jgi:hypothetical protein
VQVLSSLRPEEQQLTFLEALHTHCSVSNATSALKPSPSGLARLKQLLGPHGKYGALLRQRPVAYISNGTGTDDACSMLLVRRQERLCGDVASWLCALADAHSVANKCVVS